MVNKAAVGGLLGVVVIGVLVAGALGVLAGGDGPGPSGTPTPTELEPTPFASATATPAATTSVASTSTPTPATTEAQTTAVQTTIAADEFQPNEIESEIRKRINQRRTARGLDSLSRTKEPVKKLNRLARNHSEEMARVNDVRYDINGRSTGDRYEQFDLYGTCRWKAAGQNFVIRADNPSENQLEVIGLTIAGRPYPDDGDRRFNGNESQVADALVDEWFTGYPQEDKLLLEKATQAGVGVHVTLSGEVYATVALC